MHQNEGFLAISSESFTMADENFWIIDLKNAPEWRIFLSIPYETLTLVEENFRVIDLKNAPEWKIFWPFHLKASPWLKKIFEL